MLYNAPLISVIIPVYNGGEALCRAIISVLAQAYRHFELIIIDDFSREPLQETVRAFRDPRIVYMRHCQNQGAAAARNTAMRRAQGDFIVFLDSDDEFLPGRLSRQVDIFKSLPDDVGLLISNLQDPLDARKTYISCRIPSGYVTDKAFPGSVFSPPSSWMLRKELVNLVGFFDEEMAAKEDADYFVRILACSKIYYTKEILGVKHLSIERKGYFLPMHFSGNKRFLMKHHLKMRKDPVYLSRFYYLEGKDYLRSMQPDLAEDFFLKAFWTYPSLGYFVKYLRCRIFANGVERQNVAAR